MNSRRAKNCLFQWLSPIALCCAAIAILPAWAAPASADEKENSQRNDQQPAVDRAIRAPGLGIPGIAAPPPQRAPDDPFSQAYAPGDRNSQTLLAPPMMMGRGQEAMSPEALQKRMKELQQQQEQIAQRYQEAMKAMQQSLPRAAQLDMERMELHQRLAEAKAQIAEFSAKQQLLSKAPLPENAALKVFALRHVKPNEAGDVLFKILGNDSGMRVAIDQRTNALLLAGTDKQLSVAEALVEKLDQPWDDQRGKSSETLQVRVVWILDSLPDTEGRNVEPPFVNSQVLEALIELGFDTPRVMCQQVMTLTLEKDKRHGQFHFQVPVLVEGNPWQFQGQGDISPAADERYALEFNMSLREPKKEDCQLSGSIFTPLAHYNVLGTTTFVATSPADANSPQPYPRQHLSAFVVYLDLARGFSDKSLGVEKKSKTTP
jgi:Bacterial type II/III secretion system short domain